MCFRRRGEGITWRRDQGEGQLWSPRAIFAPETHQQITFSLVHFTKQVAPSQSKCSAKLHTCDAAIYSNWAARRPHRERERSTRMGTQTSTSFLGPSFMGPTPTKIFFKKIKGLMTFNVTALRFLLFYCVYWNSVVWRVVDGFAV